MKTMFILLSGFLLALVGAYVYFQPELTDATHSQVRPKAISKNAFWVGGLDGGNYIEIISYDPEKMRLSVKIYSDQNGETEFSGHLFYSTDKNVPTEINSQDILGWDGSSVHLVSGEYFSEMP
ncbi:hypothetical protein SMW94_004637 [Vibrio parahaemolyticus]|nr:hypothetical protein [Vibrio parahaemolyticus]